MLVACLVGFICGFIGSIPIAGPIAALVVGWGLYRSPRYAISLALGGAIVEAIYAYLTFWGFGKLLQQYPWINDVSRTVTVLLLICLGVVLVRSRPLSKPRRSNLKTSRRGVAGCFLLGVSIAASNPILLASWSSVVMVINGLNILRLDSSLAITFSIGVGLGIIAWFAILLALLHNYRQHLETITLQRTVNTFGVILLVSGIGLGLHYLQF